MKASRVIWVLALAVLAGAGGWFFHTPYATVKAIRQAAYDKDARALSSYVDFPAVKENLKASVRAKMHPDRGEGAQQTGSAAMGAALAMAVVGPMIEALVTPDTIALVLNGEIPSLERRREAERAPAVRSGPEPDERTEVRMGYESFNRFVVTARKHGDEDEPMALVLQREGLASWKLVAIRLPL
jgi:hypothetical protein